MTTWAGQLEVTPDQFPMEARRFIIRDDEISFAFRYKEDNKPGEYYRLENVAKQQPEGYYQCSDDDGQTIYILKASEDRYECVVEGFWLNDEGAWRFAGTLKQFRPALDGPLSRGL